MVRLAFLVSLGWLCLMLPMVHAGPVSARVHPVEVIIGEPVTLTISLDSTSLAVPDLSGLKTHFRILKKTNTSSLHEQDGLMQIRKNWVIQLLPMQQGNVHIPVIRVGHERTPPLSIHVAARSSEPVRANTQQGATPHGKQDLFVKVETDTREGYVQGQIIITQKIFHAIPLEKANLSPPVVRRVDSPVKHSQPLTLEKKVAKQGKESQETKRIESIMDEAAEVITLSQTPPYYWRFNGRRYHVIERSYAVFPKYSGTLRIEEATLTGLSKTPAKTEVLDLLTGGGRLKKVRAQAPALLLKIRPQIELSANAHTDTVSWLPAKNITLYRNGLNTGSRLQVGKPVTLQLGIIADGLRAGQLPDLTLAVSPQDFKVYREPAELNNTVTVTGVTGVWSQKITLIPLHSGDLSIPEFQLPWWNAVTGKAELARLRPLLLKVEKTTPQAPVIASLSGSAKRHTNTGKAGKIAVAGRLPETEKRDQSVLGWLLGAGLFVLVLGWLFYSRLRKYGGWLMRRSGVLANSSFEDKKQQVLNDLRQACLSNDPVKAETLLIQWADIVADLKPPTLEHIAAAEQGHLREAITKLSQVLYGHTAGRKSAIFSQQQWGQDLWKALEQYPLGDRQEQVQGKQEPVLQKMYPV